MSMFLAFFAICLNSGLFFVGSPSSQPSASPSHDSGASPVKADEITLAPANTAPAATTGATGDLLLLLLINSS